MAELFSYSANMCSFHSGSVPSAGQDTSDIAVNKPGSTSLDSGEPEHKHFSVRFTKDDTTRAGGTGVAWSHCWILSKRKWRKECLSWVNSKCKNTGVGTSECVQGQWWWVVGHRGVARLLRSEAAAGLRICLIRSGFSETFQKGPQSFVVGT